MATRHRALVTEGAVVAKDGDGPVAEREGRVDPGRDADAVYLDGDCVIVSWSAMAVLVTGLSAAEAVGKPLGAICADGKLPGGFDAVGADPVEIVLTLDETAGGDGPIRAVVSAGGAPKGVAGGYRLDFRMPGGTRDTGVAFTRAAAPENESLQGLGVQDPPAVLVDASDLRIIDSNPAALLAFGRRPGELAGRALHDVFDMADSRPGENRPAESGAMPTVLRLANADGGLRPWGVSLLPLRCDGKDLALCVLHDLTEWVSMKHELTQMNMELSRLARHDHLTGLFNRPMFQDTLDLANSRLDRLGGLLGVLYIDLDGFKPINDRFGHDAGDAVLVEVARRLKAGVRSSDVVARLGGDEFGAILENLKKRDDALKVARHLIACLGEPFEVEGETYRISASIGAIVASSIVEDSSSLVAQADRMMYEAKSLGRGRAALATAGAAGKPRRTHRRSGDDSA